MANALAQSIEETLRPIVGTVLASVSVDLESKRIGKTPDTITADDLDDIAENLSVQLRLVVGTEIAATAAHRLKELG